MPLELRPCTRGFKPSDLIKEMTQRLGDGEVPQLEWATKVAKGYAMFMTPTEMLELSETSQPHINDERSLEYEVMLKGFIRDLTSRLEYAYNALQGIR